MININLIKEKIDICNQNNFICFTNFYFNRIINHSRMTFKKYVYFNIDDEEFNDLRVINDINNKQTIERFLKLF